MPVQGVWRRVILGDPMFVVCEKLRLLQQEFKKLNNKESSDISTRTLAARQQLDVVLAELGTDPSNPRYQIQGRTFYKQPVSLSRAEEGKLS